MKLDKSAVYNQKNIFKTIFFYFSLLLVILPVITIFNDVITKLFENFAPYRLLEYYIVPFQAKVVGVVMIPLGFDYIAYLDGMKINGVNIGISWNCLGWQSLVLFFLTAMTALRGNYTLFSKIESVIIGILSLILINIFRIVFSATLAVLYRPLFVVVFHDYLAAATTVIWLFIFWYFAYSFVLEPKLNTLNINTTSKKHKP